MTDQIKRLVISLAGARLTEQKSKAAYDAARLAWEEANAEIITAHKGAKTNVGKIEAAIRKAAEGEFASTGNTKPVDGIAIKVFQDVNFCENIARNWALDHMPDLLVLDTKAYAKALKEVKSSPVLSKLITMPGLLVSASKATIARDLSALYLEPVAEV